MFYVYRCTTDKLEHHLNRITDSGDSVFTAQFVGGRDWVIIGQTTAPAPDRRLCVPTASR